jgi:hypothetical protein
MAASMMSREGKLPETTDAASPVIPSRPKAP